MTTVEAIFEGGVFRPVDPVRLPDRQRVQLTIMPLAVTTGPEWLDELRRERERVAAAYGPFPDTAALIAEDGRRDG
jgi:predicted DNA-binding antitoxin AbrB/MazE fold protein